MGEGVPGEVILVKQFYLEAFLSLFFYGRGREALENVEQVGDYRLLSGFC